jgi:hypothetical protein
MIFSIQFFPDSFVPDKSAEYHSSAKAADSLGITLATALVGETITINENLSTERWREPLLKSR